MALGCSVFASFLRVVFSRGGDLSGLALLENKSTPFQLCFPWTVVLLALVNIPATHAGSVPPLSYRVFGSYYDTSVASNPVAACAKEVGSETSAAADDCAAFGPPCVSVSGGAAYFQGAWECRVYLDGVLSGIDGYEVTCPEVTENTFYNSSPEECSYRLTQPDLLRHMHANQTKIR